jgi:DNA polymerase III psi subunit
MSDVLNAAKTQFRDRLSSGLSQLVIPEWEINGKPITIYYKPSMTMKEQGEVLKLANDNKQADSIVMNIIIRALDADGKRMFKRAHMTELMNETDPEILSRIVVEMNGDGLDLDDVVKN